MTSKTKSFLTFCGSSPLSSVLFLLFIFRIIFLLLHKSKYGLVFLFRSENSSSVAGTLISHSASSLSLSYHDLGEGTCAVTNATECL